MNKLAVSPA